MILAFEADELDFFLPLLKGLLHYVALHDGATPSSLP